MASANGCFPLFSRSHGKRVGYFGFRRETAGQRFGGNYDGTLVDESESAGVPPTHSREMSQRNGRAYSAAFWQRIRICRDTSVFRATSGRVLAEDTDLSQQFCILRHPADGPGTSRRMSQSYVRRLIIRLIAFARRAVRWDCPHGRIRHSNR